MKQPNILWICSDQQRWDTIHASGNGNERWAEAAPWRCQSKLA